MTKASFRTLLGGVAAGAAWIGLWFAAPEMAARAGGLFDDVRIAGAVDFFIADTAKIFLLLFLMVYLLAWLRAGLSVERVRDVLLRFGRLPGYVIGSVFGAVTPFCLRILKTREQQFSCT